MSSREELLLQFEDGGPVGPALDAAEGNGGVALLALRVHVQQRAAHLHLAGQHHVRRALPPRAVAERVALVAALQDPPGVGPAAQGERARPGDDRRRRRLRLGQLLPSLLLGRGGGGGGGGASSGGDTSAGGAGHTVG